MKPDSRGFSVGRTAALLVALIWAAGCASGPDAQQETKRADADRDTSFFDKPGIYDVDARRRLTEAELYGELDGYRFVVVGESHGVEWNHQVQSDIYSALLDRHDGSVALGMEMFQRPYQPALNAYTESKIDEATMLQRTEYDRRWGVPPRYYRPLWSAAKSSGSAILALNARQELTRAVARTPLERLDTDLKQDLPEDLNFYGEQRKFLKTIFEKHHPQTGDSDSKSGFDRFARAQVVWDATMAKTAVEFMSQSESPASILIVCGRAHAHRGFGIPPRISSLADNNRDSGSVVASVLPVSAEAVVTGKDGDPMAELNRPNAADFLWVK